MLEKNFIIFYYDVDQKGNPYYPVDFLYEIFNTISKVTSSEERLILLPRGISHSNWINKEEYIKILEQELNILKNN